LQNFNTLVQEKNILLSILFFCPFTINTLVLLAYPPGINYMSYSFFPFITLLRDICPGIYKFCKPMLPALNKTDFDKEVKSQTRFVLLFFLPNLMY